MKTAKFNYNEPKWIEPKHKYPKDTKLDTYKNPGIAARILIEKALQSVRGVNLDKLESLEVSSKDLVKYRNDIKNALTAMLREGNKSDIRLRSGAIAYLGALQFYGTADIIKEIALNPEERSTVRGSALESLARLMGKKAITTIEKLTNDPIESIREKATRAIGRIGDKKHNSFLKDISENDSDAEVRFQALSALEQIGSGKKLKRPRKVKNNKRLKTSFVQDHLKPIGRHDHIKPQSSPDHIKGIKFSTNGGENLVVNREFAKRECEPQVYPLSYEELNNNNKEGLRIKLRGKDIGNSIKRPAGADLYKIHDNEAILEFPDKRNLKISRKLDINANCLQHEYQDVFWIPETTTNPVILDVGGSAEIIWAKKKFGIQVKFYVPQEAKNACLLLKLRFPKSNWKNLFFQITQEELASGEKIINGFTAATAGAIEIQTSLYTSTGNASKYNTVLHSLPSNPISMTVSPSTSGTIGEGPAHYNSSEDRFYCYANLRVTNGFGHSVTLGPTVTIRVTDGGNEKDNFAFGISTSTIPANSTRTIGIYMFFGGDTYKVFKNYGDVTMRITLQTSEGNVVDSHVWAAMAQTKLALNFVGNFSSTTRGRLQSVVDNEASGIYEQQNLYISESANFVLPSSNSDFNRYRDIEMDDNKDSDCTSGSDEADDLRDDWSSPNDSWLDLWIVESLSGPPCAASVGGFSPVNGPTGKGGDNSGAIINMSGIDLSTTGGRNLMGIIIAHEVAHFLGLNHSGTSSNFMAASTGGSNTDITHGQYMDMTDHGFVTRFVV